LFKDHQNQYEAILLDLGGVLLNIDYSLTSKAFKEKAGKNFEALYAQAQQSDLFDRLETGAINPADFRSELRNLGFEMSDEEIDSCWNAMLLDLPESRLLFLETLCMETGLILLSNTNEIHIKHFETQLEAAGQLDRFKDCFVEVYYSSRIKKRKPEASTFKWVLNEQGLNANEVLFIDDSAQHIEGAKKAGIKAHLLEKGIEISSLFS
jgi:FMN phosphatase YigB (HAD superfamily)